MEESVGNASSIKQDLVVKAVDILEDLPRFFYLA